MPWALSMRKQSQDWSQALFHMWTVLTSDLHHCAGIAISTFTSLFGFRNIQTWLSYMLELEADSGHLPAFRRLAHNQPLLLAACCLCPNKTGDSTLVLIQDEPRSNVCSRVFVAPFLNLRHARCRMQHDRDVTSVNVQSVGCMNFTLPDMDALELALA